MDTDIDAPKKEGDIVIEETEEGKKSKKIVISTNYLVKKDSRISSLESCCMKASINMRDYYEYDELDLNNDFNTKLTISVVNWYKKQYPSIYPTEYDELTDSDEEDGKVYAPSEKKISINQGTLVTKNISFADRLKGLK